MHESSLFISNPLTWTSSTNLQWLTKYVLTGVSSSLSLLSFPKEIWKRREKTHASSPSTSGKTHEKTCPIQTRRETRESILVRTDTSFWGLWALIGDLQKEENRFLTEGQKCLTAGLLCWLDTSFPWSSTACCRDMELEFRFLLHLIPPKVEEETELWGRRPTPSTSNRRHQSYRYLIDRRSPVHDW